MVSINRKALQVDGMDDGQSWDSSRGKARNFDLRSSNPALVKEANSIESGRLSQQKLLNLAASAERGIETLNKESIAGEGNMPMY